MVTKRRKLDEYDDVFFSLIVFPPKKNISLSKRDNLELYNTDNIERLVDVEAQIFNVE